MQAVQVRLRFTPQPVGSCYPSIGSHAVMPSLLVLPCSQDDLPRCVVLMLPAAVCFFWLSHSSLAPFMLRNTIQRDAAAAAAAAHSSGSAHLVSVVTCLCAHMPGSALPLLPLYLQVQPVLLCRAM